MYGKYFILDVVKPIKITIEFKDNYVVLTGKKAQDFFDGGDVGELKFLPKGKRYEYTLDDVKEAKQVSVTDEI